MDYRSARIILSLPKIEFATLRRDFYCENNLFFKPFLPIQSSLLPEIDFHKDKLMQEISNHETENGFKFYVFLTNETDKIIGSLEFSNIVKGPFRSCNLGYLLDEKFQGNGYMEESIRRAIDFLFLEKKLHRIQAAIMPNNSKSIRLIEKIGFQKIGLAPNYLNINGVWVDHFLYQLISPELF